MNGTLDNDAVIKDFENLVEGRFENLSFYISDHLLIFK